MAGELETGGMPAESTVEDTETGGTPNGEGGTSEPGKEQLKTLDPDYVEKLKREAIDNRKLAERLRKENERLQQAEDERKRAEMTELERARADLEQLKASLAETEAKRREAALHNAVLAEAAKQQFSGRRFSDPSDALRFIDWGAVQMTDDGTIAGAADAVKAIAKAKPYLLESTTPPPADISAKDGRGQKQDDPKEREAALRQRFRI